ncbi:PREDICTED: vesicle transport protein SEC20 [Ceratosolen solmsi marchali]|uniref:Vesicle transport protein SEC20 n=1 Tax=Ceratosolen solmsi marchali TaxID=326594 RepID=A0AAJ7DUM9_9HYME|nr:PREDICTED: vesicle transport protein SEC20 [Ceratosolen solmsi marchali]
MIYKDKSFEQVSQEIIKNHLKLTALIQDIQQCTGPLEYLNELNAIGRDKITILRHHIEQLTNLTKFEHDKKKKAELLSDIDNHRGQLSTAIIAFRKANINTAWAINKLSREHLLSMPVKQQILMRRKKDQTSVSKVSRQTTDQLLDISKYLLQTTQKSGETLDTLVVSSDKVFSTRKELEDQQQVIVQSGKLLGKYGRREITDKALVILAFIFFLACVFYIIQKRLF